MRDGQITLQVVTDVEFGKLIAAKEKAGGSVVFNPQGMSISGSNPVTYNSVTFAFTGLPGLKALIEVLSSIA